MKRKTMMKHGRRVALAACGLLVGASAVMLTSCKDDDVLTGQPSWLGNSIYERLQEEGNYTTVLRLIDDLDQKEVLGHTGSKTLFAADDDAYREWYKHNSWGVSSYEQLTDAQKSLLLKNAMINNAYLIELMSNVSGTPPVEGMAMRRETATSIYDSIYVMPAAKMPGTPAWASFKDRGKSILLMKDATTAPMIHFLPAYMTFNKITAEDLAVLTNGQATSINEAWVNGKKVVERDITCKNGYIQKVDGVIESSPNMAEIVRQHPKMSKWSELLDRFSAPYYNAEATTVYNGQINKSGTKDTIYTLRYFSRRSTGGEANNLLPDGYTQAQAQLSFDPGWNHYMYSNTMGYDLHYDAGAMIVPTNEALDYWWNHEGMDLHDEYKEWDSIPDATLAKLINVNMLDVFSASVPSKFNTVLNDAKETLGITKESVDSCFMGCNGVVYMVNKVFTPAEYASVAYPALAHQSTMNIIYWGISGADGAVAELNFLPYLLSMDSQYALLLPNNDAMGMYLDPSSYGNAGMATDPETGETVTTDAPNLIEFRYDKTRNLTSRVQASRYQTSVDADGNITKGIRLQEMVGQTVLTKMLNDMIDQFIIVIPDKTLSLEDYVNQGYSLFKTKGGTLLRVTKSAGGNLCFEGGWQMDHNGRKLETKEVFQKENGRSYLLDTQMPLATEKSFYMTLKEHPEYSGFLGLLENSYCDLLTVKLGTSAAYSVGNARNGNKNMKLFDNYNYTVFVPTTASIVRLQEQKLLPEWDELTEEFEDGKEEHVDQANGKVYKSVLDSICWAEGWYDRYADLASAKSDTDLDNMKLSFREKVHQYLTTILDDFIRYHVMDRSVAIGMAPEANASGSSYESMKRNPETGRFFSLEVNFDQNSLTVKDVKGNSHSVVKTEGLYNNICREYWFSGSNNNAAIYMANDAVVHLIDQPLLYEDMKPWRDVVEEYLKNN